MRYLLLSNVMLMLAGCSYPYRSLRSLPADKTCASQFRPEFSNELYNTHVNVSGRHLSGLLLVKQMPDTTYRVVFSTETGVKFFDFAFGGQEDFKVHYIMRRLDRKVVINALRNDFNFLLMNNIETTATQVMKGDGMLYHAYPMREKTVYYLTDTLCKEFIRAEMGSSKKPLAEATWTPAVKSSPDSISIRHYNFDFSITLKKLER